MRISDWISDVCSSDLCNRFISGCKAPGGVIAGRSVDYTNCFVHYRQTEPGECCAGIARNLSRPAAGGDCRAAGGRSVGSRVGTAGVRKCRSRWAGNNYKQTKEQEIKKRNEPMT